MIVDRVRAVVEPLLADSLAELVDVEHTGGILRVTVDRPGGVDLELIARLTRQVSRALDDEDPLPGRYTLEVSSPGLERPLRTPEHFRWAVGRVVAVKAVADAEGERRVTGVLTAADEDGITVTDSASGVERTLRHDQVEKARTVFEWGPSPKPGSPGSQRKKKRKKATAP